MTSSGAQSGDTRDPAGDLPAGTLIDERFELVEYVAGGGMGFIYRARMLSTGHVVAVKVMREKLRFDSTAVKRFEREARTVSRLFHPNTITLHDFGTTEDGLMYIVMEWLEGTDLAQMLSDEGPFSPLRAAHIGSQVASSLHEAHEKGIVHRDLKPENIFMVRAMQDEDFVKVLDFGIAKIVDGPAQTQITRLGMVCGTPDFMSPEQGRGEELDGRSDVYALGCVLYTLLTGDVPFPADNPIQAVMQHQLEPLPQLPPGFPVALDNILQKAADKDRSRRFASAQEMSDALDDFIAQLTGKRSDQTDELPVTSAPVDALGATVVDQPQIDRGMGQKDISGDGETVVMAQLSVDVPSSKESRARAANYAASSTTGEMSSASGGASRWLFIGLLVAAIVGGVILALLMTRGESGGKEDKEAAEVGATEPDDSNGTADAQDVEQEPVPGPMAVAVISSPSVVATITDPEGNAMGTTPVRVEQEEPIAGVFTATAEGHEPLKRMVRVSPGDEMEIELQLTAIPPIRCAVRSSPRKAAVSRDGEVLGDTPLVFDIPAGASWELSIAKKGYEPVTTTVNGEKPCTSVVELERTGGNEKPKRRKGKRENDDPEEDSGDSKSTDNAGDVDSDKPKRRFEAFD